MNIKRQSNQYRKRRKRISRWHHAAIMLSAVIVFCTVYALILPALTMERETFCGLSEHEHTAVCYDENSNLICGIEEHLHSEACYRADNNTLEALATPDELPAAITSEDKSPPIQLAKAPLTLAATGSGSGSITYSKQIEHLGGDDNYTYRLHLTMDGSALSGSSTTTEEGESTGIVLLIDVTKDFIATTSDEQSKLTVIQNIVNNYINQFSVNQRNKISVILVKGEQSGTINSNGTVEVKKAWEGYEPITIGNQQIRYTANFKAGLVKAGQFLSSAGTDKTAVVFITNSNPQWSVTDSGQADRTVTNESEAKTATMNYLPTFLSTYPETDLYILDVEQASEVHATPKAMGEYIQSVDRGGYYTAGSSTELINSFDEIITTIIPGDKTSNIVMNDTLSANVDFIDPLSYTATLYTGSGLATATDVTSLVTVSGDTLTFSRADTIDGPFRVEVTFDIKTADGVYRDTDTYTTTGYPDTGDANTDYDGNTTSSGQPGYYSNSSGGLSYTLNGTDIADSFAHPVVQAPEPTDVTKTITVTKHWAGTLTPQEITLTVYEESGTEYTAIGTITLSAEQDATGSYSYTFPSGETTKNLYLAEDSGSAYLAMYSVDSATINPGTGEISAAQITLTADGDDAALTVTNWPKTQMPATGGKGTTPFFCIGLTLVILSAGALLYKRRRQLCEERADP